jgi:signal transduction histidine kinase
MASVLGVRSCVAIPIAVAGQLWGLMVVATSQSEPLRADTESRAAEFTELVATAIANAQSRGALAELAEEQAALRRVATLVAGGAQPMDVFAAVTVEVGRLFSSDFTYVTRYDPDDEVTVLAGWMPEGDLPMKLAGRWSAGPTSKAVLAARAPVRLDPYPGSDPVEDPETAVVAAPITVDGALWGFITVASTTADRPPPPDTESRLSSFTDVVATAISNADSKAALGLLADEQAALRRVATLVAQGVPRSDVFLAVTREVERVFAAQMDTTATVVRFDPGPECVLVGASKAVKETPIGTRWQPNDLYVSTRVLRTGGNARVDEEDLEVGVFAADQMRRQGFLSQVASPIVVEGRLWGAMTVSAAEPMPADTGVRLERFTRLVVTAVANAESREQLGVLAEEQAALRRVAMLVAQQPSPDEVFTAVTEAVAPLLRADLAAMHIFSDDKTATVIAGWSGEGPMLALGTQLPLDGDSAVARIFQSGAAARIDSYVDVEGEAAGVARGLGLRSTVGAPIVVEGKLWGALMAATRGADPLPDDAETRIAEFTELVATAVSNAESRVALGRLADEQAALRRVATLVAEGIPADELFSAVTKEVAHIFSAGESSVVATVIRFDVGPESVLVGTSREYPTEAVGDRWMPKELYVSTRVLRTGTSARVDEHDLDFVGGSDAEHLRRRGFLHQVGSPLVVEGRLWGAVTLNSSEMLPPDFDRRLSEFTELLATAIANAESRTELAASRRRMVTAADEARRGIERNLHDGVQQQLVALGMELGAVEDALVGNEELRGQVAAVTGGLRSAIDDLREISRGIHPAILSHGGLGPALKALARRSPVAVRLTSTVEGRLPEGVEVAAYYVVSEALTNVARHANASVVDIDVARQDGTLELAIRDDGVGGAEARGGTGLIGLKDRVEALGGRIAVESPAGEGTSLAVTLPLGGDAELQSQP